jgi:hypothetical protein
VSESRVAAETGDRSGIQKMGNFRRWKPLQINENEDVTVDTNASVSLALTYYTWISELFVSNLSRNTEVIRDIPQSLQGKYQDCTSGHEHFLSVSFGLVIRCYAL